MRRQRGRSLACRWRCLTVLAGVQVFDKDLKLQYHGQFDASRPTKYGASAAVTGEDLRAALDAVLAGQPAPTPWKPSIGCNVKWTPGNEPAWFG